MKQHCYELPPPIQILPKRARMITSSYGSIFRVTGLLCVEFTGHQWIPCTKDSGTELWYFLLTSPEQTTKQTVETQVIWDAIVVLWRHCNDASGYHEVLWIHDLFDNDTCHLAPLSPGWQRDCCLLILWYHNYLYRLLFFRLVFT